MIKNSWHHFCRHTVYTKILSLLCVVSVRDSRVSCTSLHINIRCWAINFTICIFFVLLCFPFPISLSLSLSVSLTLTTFIFSFTELEYQNFSLTFISYIFIRDDSDWETCCWMKRTYGSHFALPVAISNIIAQTRKCFQTQENFFAIGKISYFSIFLISFECGRTKRDVKKIIKKIKKKDTKKKLKNLCCWTILKEKEKVFLLFFIYFYVIFKSYQYLKSYGSKV